MKIQAPTLRFSCPARTQVVGRGPIQYCHLCDRAVHDLSEMTQEEASDFLAACGGQDLCVSYTVEADERVRHRPSQLGRVTLALGLGIGGLLIAKVAAQAISTTHIELGGGGVIQATLPPAALQDTVQAALSEAEQGWPDRSKDREARAQQLAQPPADLPCESIESIAPIAPKPLLNREPLRSNRTHLMRGGVHAGSDPRPPTR